MYDTIIIGSGMAGMTAALYLLRAQKKVLVIEQESIGGQIASSPRVENYPGYKSISGSELTSNLYDQIEELGCDYEFEEVLSIESKDGYKIVKTDLGTHEAKTVIIATGAKYRRLNLDREEEFIGNGISFCVACDGAFYNDKKVAVIGGGNSALTIALDLVRNTSGVTIIQDMPKLTGEPINVEKITNNPKVNIHYNSKVLSYIIENDEFKGITILESGIKKDIYVDGIFVSIGTIANTKPFENLKMDDYKYIIGDAFNQTSEEGIFVAGDCKSKRIRQLTTATSDGTIAAISCLNYLNK
ncbi:MAG: NAD(P)/FAD-dependent oxidoreductase [Acholeplasmatales bacterium]|nr:NAD(P)/FAD-dependent oxidoreductase [Acholeplasmatales bacterium]